MKYKLRLFTSIFFIFWIHIVSFSQNTTGKLKGSVSQINITPPTGGRLAGHFYEILSTGIHDSLWAKAMVFQQGKEKFAFVFCDLIGLTEDISTAARTLASAKTGIPAKNILIGATHSHNGPLFYGFQYAYFHHKALIDKKEDPHEKIDYSNFLIHQISKAIEKANESIAPIQIKVGVGEQHNLSFNRRYYMKNGPVLFNPGPLSPDIVGPAGPIDPEVGIFLINKVKSKKYEGGLIVFSMHADCIGGTEISADYPYFLEQTLKNKFGKNFISAFSVGASGDINDIDVKKDSPIYSASNTQRIGKELGKTVINKEPELKLINKPSLATVSAKIFLPLQVPLKEQIDSAKEMINNLYKASETGIYFKNAGGESGDFLKRVEMSKYISLENQKPSVQAEVQVFRIDNETAIVGLPGELFVELGIDIKRKSPFKNTMVLTVCNNRISYIPTQKAFTEGSYEVINSIVKPGSGEMLVETAIQLLNKVKSL
jgi:hypothetical protein